MPRNSPQPVLLVKAAEIKPMKIARFMLLASFPAGAAELAQLAARGLPDPDDNVTRRNGYAFYRPENRQS
jgi:hypothetical protein